MDLVPPNLQRLLSAKLCIRLQKFSRFKNTIEVLYHRAKFGGARMSPAAGTAKQTAMQLAKSQNAEFQKRQNFGFFAASKTETKFRMYAYTVGLL